MRAGWNELDWAVAERVQYSASAAVAQFGAGLGQRSWGSTSSNDLLAACDAGILRFFPVRNVLTARMR